MCNILHYSRPFKKSHSTGFQYKTDQPVCKVGPLDQIARAGGRAGGHRPASCFLQRGANSVITRNCYSTENRKDCCCCSTHPEGCVEPCLPAQSFHAGLLQRARVSSPLSLRRAGSWRIFAFPTCPAYSSFLHAIFNVLVSSESSLTDRGSTHTHTHTHT